LIPLMLGHTQATGQEAFNAAELPPYAKLLDGSVNKEAIPMTEALLGLYVPVLAAEDEEPGGGIRMLRDWVGLDPISAESLFDYIRSSFDRTQRNAAQLNAGLCPHRNEFSTPVAFAEQIAEIERLHAMQLEANLRGIADVLGEEGAEKVIQFVDENIRPTMQMVEVDHVAQIHAGLIDPATALAKACGEPPEGRVSRGSN